LKFFCEQCQKGLSEVPLLIKKIDELQRDIENLKENNATKKQAAGPFDVLQEVNEREIRARNVIMYDIPESNAEEAGQRIQYDKEEAAKIIKSITDVPTDKIKVFRLGRVQPGQVKSRPLKVILQRREHALQILKSKKKLNKPNIKGDLTKAERDHLKCLRDELKGRQDRGEGDITIKYVRGCPKIVQLKTQKN
jgi:hypothetical protein